MTIFKNNRHRARLTAFAVACALTWGAAPAQQHGAGPAADDDHAGIPRRRPHADHRGSQPDHGQDLHRRSARARAGDDPVLDADVAGCVLRDVPVDPAGARLRRGAGRQLHQDHSRRQRAPGAGPGRPAGAGQRRLRRIHHAGHRRAQRERRAAGAGAAAADPAVRPPGRVSGLEHADHLGPRQQRQPHDAHHPAHRPGRRRGNRHRAAGERERRRDRARRQRAEPGAGPAGGSSRHGRPRWSPTTAPTAC